MTNRFRLPFLVSTFIACLTSAAACTAESDLGDHAGADASTEGDGGVDPGEDAASVGDGATKDAGSGGRTDAGTTGDSGSIPIIDSGTSDTSTTPPSCASTTFQVAQVVPMPSGYVVAGFNRAWDSLVFTTLANPRKLFRHAIADLASGSFQVLGEDAFYHPEETIHSIAGGFSSAISARRITQFTTSSGAVVYRVRSGSDANLADETGNLPTLDSSSRITTMYRKNASTAGSTGLYVVRAGSEVYGKEAGGQTWSLIANLAGSGTTAWEGLALRSEPTSPTVHVFLRASVNGGPMGIVEQRWPSALASNAEAPVVVVPSANATPFGVSADGCKLYASRQNGPTLEVVFYAR